MTPEQKRKAGLVLGAMAVATAGVGLTVAGVPAAAVAVPLAVAAKVLDIFLGRKSRKEKVRKQLTQIRADRASSGLQALKQGLLSGAELVPAEHKSKLEELAAAAEDPKGVRENELLIQAVGELFEETHCETESAEELGRELVKGGFIQATGPGAMAAGRDIHAEGATQIFGDVYIYNPTPGPKGVWDLKVSLAKLPITSPDLFGRDDELAALDTAWGDGQANIFTLVAWGGVGKTALVNSWIDRMQADGYRGAERVYGWSFYSQGAGEDRQASSEPFVDAALRWFGDPDPTAGSSWEKADRLAGLIQASKTLLILDGLEPLQHPLDKQKGSLKEPAMLCLLTDLARHNPGLCIITSRLNVEGLGHFGEPIVTRVSLDHLSDVAGAELLEKLGVDGTPDERMKTSRKFDGHALALRFLGNYLAEKHGGDIRKQDEIPAIMDDPDQGGHARRVMSAYENWFAGRPELNILYVLGLFDRPAQGGAIRALRAEPVVAGLTDTLAGLTDEQWQAGLDNLRNLGLLAAEDSDNSDTLDCHPLVREHFGERLKKLDKPAWKEGHRRLYEYYRSVPKQFPGTLEEMAPLYAAVPHGCFAGRYLETYDEVYRRRIHRGREYFSVDKLGAVGLDLAAISNFFDPPWSAVVTELRESSRSFLLNEAGLCLRALGRLGEAVEPMQAGFDADVELEDRKNAAVSATNLSELYLATGSVPEAVEWAEKSVELADQSQDAFERLSDRTTLADALHQAGDVDKAEELFKEAEKIQKGNQPELPLLYSVQGVQYCDLLLGRGRFEDVIERASKTLGWAQREQILLDIALDNLSLGRAKLKIALRDEGGDVNEAGDYMDTAVEGLRRAGAVEFLVLGLLGRIELNLARNEWTQVERDLDEAFSIAQRSEMRLHLVDCHLAEARLLTARGDDNRPQAIEAVKAAEELIDRTGYNRRKEDVEKLKGDFGLSS